MRLPLGLIATIVGVASLLVVSGEASQEDNRLITPTSMGPVRLGMTLAEVRAMLPAASFKRGSDGDGAALIEIVFGEDDYLVLWAAEEDPNAPIDWTRQIVTMKTFSKTFHTAEDVRPGAPVADIIKTFGPVSEIVRSEIESREYIEFERQPAWLGIRLDYVGIFPDGQRRTKEYRPGARILGFEISANNQ